MGTTPQKNSFVTLAEQVSLLNNNAVEIITKMHDVVNSESTVVSVKQTDSNGIDYTYSLPSVGKLQADITELNNNVKRLAGLNDNNVHIINGKSTKKIYLSDLNREPNRIDSIDNITTFNQTNNWFFESLMNPILSIKFDLTNKVGNDVDGVISRRYIVKFEKNKNGFTQNGLIAKNSFVSKFVNKTNINLNDFISWHTNPTNTGTLNYLTPQYDEQYFNFDYQEISDYGLFSIEKQETDKINNKMWYHIYPYRYVSSSGQEKTLKVNDELMLNKQDSVTRYKIIETSSASSNFRIRVERIEGFDPIPTGTNVLRYYGVPVVKKTVNISVGFDEYLVIFMKPTNSRNKIKGSLFSQGVGLYTNDLTLDTDSNVSMSQFYMDTVYDYGTLIKDLIKKQIPSEVAVVPDAPTLLNDNFKVVQINKHLTDTEDTKLINELHSQKNNLKTKLEQINNAIIQKNQDLSVKKYASVSERDKDVAELAKLIKDQETYTTNYYSITTQLKSKTDIINKVDPKFRIRGFWDIPAAKVQGGYRDQEVIQFRIQYRYSAKNGTENQTEGYELVTSQSANQTKTGYFSNWNEIKTDLRKRSYNEATGEWFWEVEEVSNPDTVNINQLDIAINAGEKIDIRIKSISEVGYPDSIVESPWSNIITLEFPENLNSVMNSNDFVLKQAEQDNIKTEFELTLNSKGLSKHVQDAFYINESYIAHPDDKIVTNYKDLQGNTYNLRQYLEFLTNKIASLESIIYSAKGVLKISVFDGNNEIEVKNNSEVTISVILQNHAKSADGIIYENNLYKISDYYIKIENLSSTSALKFLVTDSYIYGTKGTVVRQNNTRDLVSLVDNNGNLLKQVDGQWLYFCDTLNNSDLYLGDLTDSSGTTFINSVVNPYRNIGLSHLFENPSKIKTSSRPITGLMYGGVNEWFTKPDGLLGTTILPVIKSINELIPSSKTSLEISNVEDIKIPLNLYFVLKTHKTNSINDTNKTVNINSLIYTEHSKSIRVRMNPTTLSTPFDFVVNFNIQNKRM